MKNQPITAEVKQTVLDALQAQLNGCIDRINELGKQDVPFHTVADKLRSLVGTQLRIQRAQSEIKDL
jgi:hypothetical protein